VVIVVAVTLGIAIRVWFIFHLPLNADEAIDGLMARQIIGGHFTAFYWGQNYGGVEPYVTALLFLLLGQGSWVVLLGPALLSALAAILTWRIALRLVQDRPLAMLAGTMFWCLSEAALWNSTYEWGFRGVTMMCGLGALLMALRIVDGHLTFVDAALFGAFAGLGWWSSPEIVYFLPPVGILLVMAYRQTPGARRLRLWVTPVAIGMVSALLCALPWIWVNVRTHFASVRRGTFHTQPGVTFTGNLSAFFHHAFPIELGLQRLYSGQWLLGNGPSFGPRLALIAITLVVFGAIVGSIVICLLSDGRNKVIAVALLAFPLLYAASPATGYWRDGRYVVYVGPFVVLVLAVASGELARQRIKVRNGRWKRLLPRNPRSVTGIALVLALGLVLVGFHQAEGQSPISFFRAWSNPDEPAQKAVNELVSKGITDGYANYWIAYKLDFVGRGVVQFTTAGNDPDRSHEIDVAVARARQATWLFVPDGQAKAAALQFVSIDGPGGWSESGFCAWLTGQHIGYRIIRTGLFVGVLPDRRVPVVHAALQPAD
jgi:energy-converting hydrogenase Eha subunit C